MKESKCFAKQRTKCFSVKFVILSWTFLFAVFSCFLETGGDNFGCENYKALLDKKGLSELVNKEPPRTQGSGDALVCGKEGRRCCSVSTEALLIAESKKDYSKSVKATLSQLGTILATRVTRFDDFFKKLLAESKRDFDAMFQKTYGVIYRQNSYVFTDLFEELERYYSKGQVDLEEAMETFFNTLYQKMFTVLNAQYQFDDKYLECIGDHMKALEPFGDVPQKLSVQIKRSFVATRTFAQALGVARDVVEKMQNLALAGDCSRAVTRMTYCAACRGLPEAKPCGTLCLNIAKGCLAYHSALDAEWNNFVEAMDKVSDRLLGPFNIEVVVDPIDIKISEAIMNFQENAHDVSEKVFSGCGRLQLARHRRAPRELELETYQFSKEETKSQPTLEKLIKDIRQKVKDSKSFWTSLPYQMCIDDKLVAPPKENNCWNGTRVARYNRRVWDNGLSSQQTNPEVTVDTSRPRSVLNEQIYTLKMVTSKLKNAYNGLDVNWIDNEGSFSEDVGSGSGPEYGSGDGSLEHEGSGHGANDYDDDDEGGDDDDTGGEPPHVDRKPPRPPISPNNESNHIPTSTDHGVGVDQTRVRSGSSGANSRNHLVLAKAIASYLLPICVVWLGGILSDWL